MKASISFCGGIVFPCILMSMLRRGLRGLFPRERSRSIKLYCDAYNEDSYVVLLKTRFSEFRIRSLDGKK